MELSMSQVTLRFSTCITPFGERTGEFTELDQELIEEFLEKVARLDGIDKLDVKRYGMVVSYRPWITNASAIGEHVQEVINELVCVPDSELFPLRGEQPVSVEFVKPPAAQPTTMRTIWVGLTTDLYPIGVNTNVARGYIGAQVAHFDGARGYAVGQRSVRVLFDSVLASDEKAFDHIRQALTDLCEQRSTLPNINPFPYVVGKAALELTHDFRDGYHLD